MHRPPEIASHLTVTFLKVWHRDAGRHLASRARWSMRTLRMASRCLEASPFAIQGDAICSRYVRSRAQISHAHRLQIDGRAMHRSAFVVRVHIHADMPVSWGWWHHGVFVLLNVQGPPPTHTHPTYPDKSPSSSLASPGSCALSPISHSYDFTLRIRSWSHSGSLFLQR